MNCLFPPPLALLPRLNLFGFRVHSNPWRGPGAISIFSDDNFHALAPRSSRGERKVGTSERASEVPAEREVGGHPATSATSDCACVCSIGRGGRAARVKDETNEAPRVRRQQGNEARAESREDELRRAPRARRNGPMSLRTRRDHAHSCMPYTASAAA